MTSSGYKNTIKFSVVASPSKTSAMSTPSVINVGLDKLSKVNILKDKKEYQRMTKIRLKEFLKDYRKAKEDQMEQAK